MTAIIFCLYDLQTGQIATTGSCDDSLLADQPRNPGQGALQIASSVYPRDWYINVTASPVAAAARPDFPGAIDKTGFTADGNDGATLSGLPNPCTVTVMGPGRKDVTIVTGGALKVTATQSGYLNVYVEAFPTKLYTANLIAQPPTS